MSELVALLPADADAIAGLELDGIPLATMVSQLSGLPALFVRKEAKDYGTCRLAEGGEVDGRRLAVVEDVVTTGGQLLLSCAALREAGGRENLAAEGLGLRSVLTASSPAAAR